MLDKEVVLFFTQFISGILIVSKIFVLPFVVAFLFRRILNAR